MLVVAGAGVYGPATLCTPSSRQAQQYWQLEDSATHGGQYFIQTQDQLYTSPEFTVDADVELSTILSAPTPPSSELALTPSNVTSSDGSVAISRTRDSVDLAAVGGGDGGGVDPRVGQNVGRIDVLETANADGLEKDRLQDGRLDIIEDTPLPLPAATDTDAGVVRLATDAQIQNGAGGGVVRADRLSSNFDELAGPVVTGGALDGANLVLGKRNGADDVIPLPTAGEAVADGTVEAVEHNVADGAFTTTIRSSAGNAPVVSNPVPLGGGASAFDDLTGTIAGSQISDDRINNRMIANNAVHTAQIQNDAVTEAKLAQAVVDQLGGVGGGLNEDAVDARVTAGVLDPAETGNSDRWPTDKVNLDGVQLQLDEIVDQLVHSAGDVTNVDGQLGVGNDSLRYTIPNNVAGNFDVSVRVKARVQINDFTNFSGVLQVIADGGGGLNDLIPMIAHNFAQHHEQVFNFVRRGLEIPSANKDITFSTLVTGNNPPDVHFIEVMDLRLTPTALVNSTNVGEFVIDWAEEGNPDVISDDKLSGIGTGVHEWSLESNPLEGGVTPHAQELGRFTPSDIDAIAINESAEFEYRTTVERDDQDTVAYLGGAWRPVGGGGGDGVIDGLTLAINGGLIQATANRSIGTDVVSNSIVLPITGGGIPADDVEGSSKLSLPDENIPPGRIADVETATLDTIPTSGTSRVVPVLTVSKDAADQVTYASELVYRSTRTIMDHAFTAVPTAGITISWSQVPVYGTTLHFYFSKANSVIVPYSSIPSFIFLSLDIDNTGAISSNIIRLLGQRGNTVLNNPGGLSIKRSAATTAHFNGSHWDIMVAIGDRLVVVEQY